MSSQHAYRGSGPYIFLSYAHKDKRAAQRLIASIGESGFNVWYDEGVHPGVRWSDELAQRITGASHFLFLATSNSTASQHCLDEIGFALDRGLPFLAVHRESTELPEGLSLRIGARQALLVADPEYRMKLREFLGADPDRVKAGSRAFPRRFWLIGACTVLVVTLLIAVMRWFPQEVPIESDAVAVLPFASLGDAQNPYGIGLSHEIAARLSGLPGLKVLSMRSTLRYLDSLDDPQMIAAQLGVPHLVEGSIRISGDNIRITAHLINTASGVYLWSDTYEGTLAAVPAIETRVAEAVAAAFKLTLDAQQLDRIRDISTGNLAAYEQYLTGRTLLLQLDRTSVRRAITHLDRAIELDTGYSAPMGAKALALFLLAQPLSTVATDEPAAMALARQQALAALELAPANAEARMALGQVLAMTQWDWEAAEQQHLLALDAEPGSAMVHSGLGILYLMQGRFDEAIEFGRQAVDLEPLVPATLSGLGQIYFFSGHWHEAIGAYDEALQLQPENLQHRFFLVRSLFMAGRWTRYFQELGRIAPKSEEGARRAFEAGGREAIWRLYAEMPGQPRFLQVHDQAHVGEYEPIMAYLKERYASGNRADVLFVRLWPGSEAFRESDWYQDFMNEVGLGVIERR